MQLGVLRLGVLQLDSHLVPGGDVRCDVDVPKASTSDLSSKSVSSRDPDVHFACNATMSGRSYDADFHRVVLFFEIF